MCGIDFLNICKMVILRSNNLQTVCKFRWYACVMYETTATDKAILHAEDMTQTLPIGLNE